MKLNLEAIEKYRTEGVPALILLAEQEKLLGNLPKDKAGLQTRVQAILKNQAAKVLTDSMELIQDGDLLVSVFQL
ncbi:MAG: hypothetical protein JWP91_3052, partial [Fibrobacteres bacterium]|nr:hypothetical protein [Fibrobacterota bacterium]